jgi:hypothetical protein
MDSRTTLACYTRVFDYRGSTYVRQFLKEDFSGSIAQAVLNVLDFLDSPVTNPTDQAYIGECWRELIAPTGIYGVWCISLLVHNEVSLVHVVS